MHSESQSTDPLSDNAEPKDPTLRLLRQMERLQRARDAARADLADEPPEPAVERAVTTPAVSTPPAAISARLASIERDLKRREGDGYFVSLPLKPENEFPTLLARLPIFRPSRRRRQQKLQDVDNAIEFATPFGTVKRYGPPLTIRDEDTLIALMRLRSRRLYGEPGQLPAQLPNIYQTDAGKVGVHFVVCSIEQLNREMGLKHGGTNFRATFDSVKRLGATTLELNLAREDRYLRSVTDGRMIDLIDLQWQTYEEHGLLVVQFPPVIARWLEREYTYISWQVRRQLSDLSKALHRFLSSQPRRYRGDILKLAATVGYDGPAKNIKPRFGGALDELVQVGWLESYAFEGSARTGTLKLVTSRANGTTAAAE